MSPDYGDYVSANARLVMLKELAKQPAGTLNEALMARVLDVFGYRRSREWVRSQMRGLADVGAVELTEAGTVLIAKLRRQGRDHVEGRIVLDGIDPPSEV